MLHRANHRTERYRRRKRDEAFSSAAQSVNSPSTEQQAKKIRLLLQERDPEHACFGLYLASRLDLFPGEFCRELALIPDTTTPILAEDLQAIIALELGSRWERGFTEFDYAPVESTLISQSHRARLRTGAHVKLVALRPRYNALENSETLEDLDTKLIAEYCADGAINHLLADFTAVLRRKTNLLVGCNAMGLLARDAASFELLRSHKSYAELCSPRLLVFEALEEQGLDQILPAQSRNNDVLAGRLCQVWLHQALSGQCFPVDPQLHNILISDSNQISFVNCDLVGLPAGVKENLSSYFNAMLADDPDRASTYLLREMYHSTAGKIDFDSFRTCFRQAAYFGMLEPVLGTNSNAIAQIVFQHWKTALDHGYAPKPHLLCFYRGLFTIARIAYKLSPAGDPLREGFMELRMTSAFDQVRTIFDWRHWYQNSDTFASGLLNFPAALDDTLSKAAAPQQTRLDYDKGPPTHERRAVFPTALILLLVLAGTQLLQIYPWSEKTSLLVLMLAGFLALHRLDA